MKANDKGRSECVRKNSPLHRLPSSFTFIEPLFTVHPSSPLTRRSCRARALYKSRWAIEAFFKQLKQGLAVSDFLGQNKNAIQWQVWMAILVYILLRY